MTRPHRTVPAPGDGTATAVPQVTFGVPAGVPRRAERLGGAVTVELTHDAVARVGARSTA